MYFNFDKTAAALLIYIFFLSPTQLEALRPKDLGLTALLLVGLVAVALPLTSWVGFVHLTPKFLRRCGYGRPTICFLFVSLKRVCFADSFRAV
jgi:hypothetical protein